MEIANREIQTPPSFINPLPNPLSQRQPQKPLKSPRVLVPVAQASQEETDQLTKVGQIQVQGPAAVLGVVAGSIGERVRRTIWNTIQQQRVRRWDRMGRELLGVSSSTMSGGRRGGVGGNVQVVASLKQRLKKVERQLDKVVEKRDYDKEEIIVVDAMEVEEEKKVEVQDITSERKRRKRNKGGSEKEAMMKNGQPLKGRRKKQKRKQVNTPVEIFPPTFSHLDHLKAEASKKR